LPVLQVSNTVFQGKSGRVVGPRVFKAFVNAWTFLDIGRGGVNRGHDRPGGWIGLLTSMDRPGFNPLSAFCFFHNLDMGFKGLYV